MDAPRNDESLDDTVELPATEREEPASIGPYRVVRPLAYGTNTRLYEVASSDAPDQRLVLKQLQDRGQEGTKWFTAVATAMKTLDHPNIVPCHSFVDDGEQCFMVMPFVEGSSLLEIVRQGTIESARLMQIVNSVGVALDYAHDSGIVHGNLHPKHILLDETDHASLIGFAELGSGRHCRVFGNPHHLAPEQCESNSTLPATDVYALAEVCYLCLCGLFPFGDAGGAVDLLKRKRVGPIPSIRERRPELSKRVDKILQRGMAISPEQRFPSAGEFSREFSAALSRTRRRSE